VRRRSAFINRPDVFEWESTRLDCRRARGTSAGLFLGGGSNPQAVGEFGIYQINLSQRILFFHDAFSFDVLNSRVHVISIFSEAGAMTLRSLSANESRQLAAKKGGLGFLSDARPLSRSSNLKTIPRTQCTTDTCLCSHCSHFADHPHECETIVNAPSSTKNSSGKRVPAMHQAKKGSSA